MTLTDPQRYVHRRTFVEAVRYDGTEEGARALVAWVNGHATDHAQVRADGDLLVRTQLRWATVPTGWWVGLGYIGQFWVISNEVHAGCYEPVEGTNYLAVVDRDTAAAMVVAADELTEAAERSTDITGRACGMVEQLRTYVHQLATTAEALR